MHLVKRVSWAILISISAVLQVHTVVTRLPPTLQINRPIQLCDQHSTALLTSSMLLPTLLPQNILNSTHRLCLACLSIETHQPLSSFSRPRPRHFSSRLITNQGDDHTVEVEEEHEKMEPKFDKGLLLVNVQLAEDLRRIQEMLIVDKDSKWDESVFEPNAAREAVLGHLRSAGGAYFFAFQATSGRFNISGNQ